MAEEHSEIEKRRDNGDTQSPPVPQELQKILDALPPQGAKGLLSIFLSRSSTSLGPDPETARVLTQAEMHEEECRLKGYQASLENREKQNQRDHEFRKKKLNHSTGMTTSVLVVTVAGIALGLGLYVNGNETIGGPVLVASFTMLSGLAGKLLSSRDRD